MTHSFDDDYWNRIWQGESGTAMARSDANPYLVREVADLAPGAALDAGCGAGAEAIWLAEHGWRVTGADVAAAALAVAADRAAASGACDRIRWVQADLSSWEPETRFDLVTTHYAHPAMPQLEFYDRIATWVAPGGTLLIVGHLHHADTSSGSGHEHGRGPGSGDAHTGSTPPPAASVTAADVTVRLDPATWEVVTAREAPRTITGSGGRTTTIRDVVVRASRRGPVRTGKS